MYGASIHDSSKLLIEVPYYYDLDINCSGVSNIVKVEQLEGDVQIQAMGDCVLSKLKSQSLSVATTHGAITGLSSLIGDAVLSTANHGQITVDKLQGNDIKISCEDGYVRIKSLYCGDAVVTSSSGHVYIGDAHGKCSLFSSAALSRIQNISVQ